MSEVVKALGVVRSRITALTKKFGLPREPILMLASKTKPPSVLKLAYDQSHRHFGENYVQELLSKAPELPNDIKWHFIGHLQSNKSGVPNLYMVEGVDSLKLASALDRACKSVGREKLRVLVQVNTSGEASKFGCEPKECTPLMRHVLTNCDSLELAGLMTIGRLDAEPMVEWFESLRKCRDAAAQELKLDAKSLELSMGMSADYELAIEHGSTQVRVGSTIFGAREYTASKPPAAEAGAGAGADAGAGAAAGEGVSGEDGKST